MWYIKENLKKLGHIFSRPKKVPDYRMINILIVDDEESVSEITKIFLEKTGLFNATCEISAKNAIEMLKTNIFDAVVSDYEMPGLNGIEFLKTVRKSGNNIPFIIFTGRSREDVVIEALNCGVDSYIQKGGDLKSQFAELTHRIITSVEKKRAENELIFANEYNKCLIEAHVDPLVTIDCDGIIDDVNNSMEDMALCGRSSLIGKPFCDLFTKPAEVREALNLVLNNEELSDYPLYLKSEDGPAIPVLLFATLYHTGQSSLKGNSKVKGIFAELHYAGDNPDAKKSGKTKFSTDFYMDLIMHDIKNAICTGFGYCEVLSEIKNYDTEGEKYLEKTLGCFKRIERTLNCVKCLKSINSVDFSPKSVSLDEIMDEEISCYTNNTINYNRCGAYVMADSLLGSVFENIFGNAVKYGNFETKINVITKDLGDSVLIAVEDNSSGMPPEIIKDFSEGKYVRDKPCGHDGLGLFIISSLVSRYGGSVSARERVKGEPWSGTTIYLTLKKGAPEVLENEDIANEATRA